MPATVDQSIYDSIVEVDTSQAYKEARELAKTEGFLVGTSSGPPLQSQESWQNSRRMKAKRSLPSCRTPVCAICQ